MRAKHALGHLSVSPGTVAEVADQAAAAIRQRRKLACVPINVTKYAMAKHDLKLRRAINHAELTVADGLPIVWLARRAGFSDVSRVTGIGLADELLERAQTERWRVFLLGTSAQNLALAIDKLRSRMPELAIVGSRDGYFSPGDAPAVVAEINASRPDILLLGLGLPQKEYFLQDYFDSLEAGLVLAVGGAFDVWAGVKKRAPHLVQKLGLEWAYRSLSDINKATSLARSMAVFCRDLVFYRQPSQSPPTR